MKTKSLWQRLLSLFVVCTLLLSSCTDLTEVENSIKDLQEDVAELQTKVTTLDEALNSLRTAYESGMTIKSIEPITSSEMEGWKVTFTNDKVITIMSDYIPVPNGITIESIQKTTEGVVVITLSDGQTFNLNEYPGVVIASIEQDPMTGVVTILLADGTQFEFSLEVNYPTGVVLLSDGLAFDQENVATFEFRVNPSNATINYNLEGENPQVKLDLIATRADAESYVTPPTNYQLTNITPSLNEKGEVKVGQYTVTVTDLGLSEKYDEQIALVIQSRDNAGNAIEITSSTTMGIIKKQPEFTSFSINGRQGTIIDDKISVIVNSDVNLSSLIVTFTTEGSKVYVGNVEQVSGVTVNDFSEPITYRVVNTLGKEKEYQVAPCFSNLPVAYISTPNGAAIVDKENWIEGSKMIIANAEGKYEAVYEEMEIRGRGNSTWSLPKKPYNIKLDKKAQVLGMKKHKRWCLLANYLDRTLIRNAVSFEIARKMTGLAWTPSGDFVDLVLNGEFQGSYYICEHIKIDENRVNIAEIETTDTTEPNITGGYLIEMDTNYDEPYKFKSTYLQMPVNIKEPDDEVITSYSDVRFNYIQSYINNIERILSSSNFNNYQNLIDIDSYIDYWLVYEITGNKEPNHPKSVYMHKDREGKLTAGPVWDFDWGSFSPSAEGGGYNNSFVNNNAVWYGYLFKDPAFKARVKERWATVKPILNASIPAYIDEQAAKVKASSEINIKMWPIEVWRPNGDEDMTFDAAVNRLKTQFQNRMTLMDQLINNL